MILYNDLYFQRMVYVIIDFTAAVFSITLYYLGNTRINRLDFTTNSLITQFWIKNAHVSEWVLSFLGCLLPMPEIELKQDWFLKIMISLCQYQKNLSYPLKVFSSPHGMSFFALTASTPLWSPTWWGRQAGAGRVLGTNLDSVGLKRKWTTLSCRKKYYFTRY